MQAKTIGEKLLISAIFCEFLVYSFCKWCLSPRAGDEETP
jgi:hypothetical protein